MSLVSRTKFGEICGVSRQAIFAAIEKGTELSKAFIDGRVDTCSVEAIDYAAKRGVDISTDEYTSPYLGQDIRIPNTGGRKPTKKEDDGKLKDLGIPDDILEYADKSFREVVTIFGTDMRMSDWLKNLKLMEEISGKQLQNRQTQGKLVPRELVEKHIISYLTSNNERMLQDAPRAIASRVSSMVKSGEALESVIPTIQEIMSKYIKDAKDNAKKGLRRL